MTAKRLTVALIFFLFSIPISFAQREFEVVPDTVGIGLQKNFDIVDLHSSDEKRCVLYHLGNPWSTNVTGWIKVEGDLAPYFLGNEPETVFVSSGTFRYNSSCCLLPIYACFEFPYVLEDTYFSGKVSSDFTRSGAQAASGTGSATGSSVAYTLTAHIKPFTEATFSAGQKKCFDIYLVGERCFSAPWIVFSDTTEQVYVEGHAITFTYKNNRIMLAVVVLLVAGGIYYFKKRSNENEW